MFCRCGWEFDEAADFFCSGCGKKFARLERQPENENLVLFQTLPIVFRIKNVGEVANELSKIETEVNFNGVADLPKVLENGKEFNFSLDFPDVTLHQQFTLKLKTKAETLTYFLNVQEKPVFSFEFENAFEKGGEVFFDRGTGNLRGRLNNSAGLRWNSLSITGENFVSNVDDQTFQIVFGLNPSVTLEADFQETGTQSFTLELKPYDVSNLEITSSVSFAGGNDFVIYQTGRERKFNLVLSNSRTGRAVSPLRITHVVSQNDWLKINSAVEETILNDKETKKIQCGIFPNLLPEFGEKQKNFEGKIAVTYEDVVSGEVKTQEKIIAVTCRKPEDLTVPLVIDFGTTNSCFSFYNRLTNEAEVFVLENHGDFNLNEIPTVLFFQKFSNPHHTIEFGQAALARRSINFKSVAFGFKKLLKENPDLNFLDEKGSVRGFQPTELTQIFLKEMIERFQNENPYKAQRVLVTFPAVFREEQKERIKQAVQDLGFAANDVLMEISEPEALALNHVLQMDLEEGEEKVFAVFDCGGGTTDFTVCKFHKNNDEKFFKILATDGDEELGGEFLTYLLAKKIYELANLDKGKFPFPQDSQSLHTAEDSAKKIYRDFREKAENLKCNLQGDLDKLEKDQSSDLTLTIVGTDGQAQNVTVNLTYENFKEAITPSITKGFDKLDKIIKRLHTKERLNVANLDFLLLGGNSSKLGLILETAIGKISATKHLLMPEVKIGVVKGAAYFSGEFAGIRVEGTQQLLYSIGFEQGGKFKIAFEQWTSSEKSKSVYCRRFKVTQSLRNFSVFENQDWENEEPQIIGNPQVKCIREIPVPQELSGKFVMVELTLAKDGLTWKLFVSDTQFGDYTEFVTQTKD
ncbi:Hsp70 family protein [bacterium]|nr:Hsp70 family protein [bacterium]